LNAEQELYGLLVPLLDERLLVPRACVAEVTGFQPLQEMPGAPPWYLGIAAWNGRGIPVVSFEGACGKGSRQSAAAHASSSLPASARSFRPGISASRRRASRSWCG